MSNPILVVGVLCQHMLHYQSCLHGKIDIALISAVPSIRVHNLSFRQGLNGLRDSRGYSDSLFGQVPKFDPAEAGLDGCAYNPSLWKFSFPSCQLHANTRASM